MLSRILADISESTLKWYELLSSALMGDNDQFMLHVDHVSCVITNCDIELLKSGRMVDDD